MRKALSASATRMELRSEAKRKKILIAETIGNNIDLLTEILVRLPVKPLMKFKCVSKQWLSLISNPQFCLSHSRHHHSPYPTATALLLKKGNDSSSSFEIVPLKQDTKPKVPFYNYLKRRRVYLEQSCNGLLLCSSKSFVERSGTRSLEDIHYICNPITKKFKKLPSTPCSFGEYFAAPYMAFDPVKSNLYKVICIRRSKNTDYKYQIDMYSSETDSWRPLDITFTLPLGMMFSVAVFCKGAVHWYSDGETSLYFDVDRECLKKMPMPNLPRRCYLLGIGVRYFGESRGHLHLIVTKPECPSPLQFDVLEMATNYSGWFVRYHVNLDAVRIAFPEHNFTVLHVIQAQKEEESIVVLRVGNTIISYNVHDGVSKKLYVPVTNDYTWDDTFPYFEALTSV